MGEAARDPKRFPLLLKFLFPHEKLSVQVHPDDAQASASGQPWGKTECWYVAHAKPGSQVGLGLKPGVTAGGIGTGHRGEPRGGIAQLDRHLCRGHDLCGRRHGTHAGAGLGDRGDATAVGYHVSLYDYGRPRELHLKDGMAAVKEKVTSGKVMRPAPCRFRYEESSGSFGRGPVFCGRPV